MTEQELRVNALLIGQREATAQAVVSLTERCGTLTAEIASLEMRLAEARKEIESLKPKEPVLKAVSD